jgi:hypothetical protein
MSRTRRARVAQVQSERLRDAQRSASALEEQLVSAQNVEEALRGRLRALTASAQSEVERGTSQISELHEARQRQLRLEHTQLAELHAQSSSALKSMADQRSALDKEAQAHRRTQEQLCVRAPSTCRERHVRASGVRRRSRALARSDASRYCGRLALHETMQRERDAFAAEMASDADARAQLPVVLAELASTRKLLEDMSKGAAGRLGTSAIRSPGKASPKPSSRGKASSRDAK